MKHTPSSSQQLSYIHLPTIFFSIISFSLLQTNGSNNETDRLALLQIRQHITNDPNGIFNSWNSSNHLCNWFGVSCGRRHKRVVSLDLQSRDLEGTLSPHVGNLSFLGYLNLQNNSLHGEIPSEISNLFRLQHFNLGNNSFFGEIPANLSRCYRLRRIILQYNNLSGEIPNELGGLANLQVLAVAVNNLTGEIPASLGNLSSLVFFSLASNNLAGNISEELGRSRNMNVFNIADNHLSGTIHPSLFNISSLVVISLSVNQFAGELPQNLGLTLPNIQEFEIAQNRFSGLLPDSLSNATGLGVFDIVGNKFAGKVPNTLGSLKSLQWLNLGENNLVNEDWSFLVSLTNCNSLQMLDLSSNNFSGALPDSIGNFSPELSELYLEENQITGTIPITVENLTELIGLSIENNFLIGAIPSNLDKFQNLQSLSFSKNRLSGPIPSSLGNLTNLFDVDLSHNTLEGSIPDSIKNCKSLQSLLISHNLLNGTIPMLLPLYLTSLNLSGNFFTQHIPEAIGKLGSINQIDLSENRLSGEIPQSISECLSLESLHLQGNSLQGKIPSSFSSLRGLQNLDLSRNNLTGEIPPYLQNLSFARYLNLSFNDLEGEVPTQGVFRNVSLFSVAGNKKICGGLPELGLPKCFIKPTHKEKHHAHKSVAIAASIAIFVVLLSAILVVYCWRKPKGSNPTKKSLLTEPHVEVSYRDLHQATDGFSSDNLIGSGSFGLVYKGFLTQLERDVAIKVIKLEEKKASNSFMVECKALRSVRHRNLVKLLTYCSSLDYKGNEFKALIFEFMGNGSLEKWLDRGSKVENQHKSLSFLQRLNITIDVASALHYLHDLCEGPIIHCDLKPSNILLDDNFVAHLSDFGLAKLFFSINNESQSQISSIGVKGTIGYAPPEYGLGGMASKEGDVYSFGILVLELFSGKKPTHDMFNNGLNLHDFVRNGLPQSLFEVMDRSLLSDETKQEETTMVEIETIDGNSNLSRNNQNQEENLLSIFKIGLECSTDNPKERRKIGDVVKELHLIRSNLLGVRIYG